eukprot:TRINITY_DN72682_c0_g1_i1.p1 TRINITY_DN72682_c0_g1~~TRINITY_DN72682_c0_g1_i1.p1  ORF type:complete len:233 (+),score=32.09 TRINITY_DN72682_c0_g1_i1:94-792(+)
MSLVEIECGEIHAGVRRFKKFVHYFQREVEIFQVRLDDDHCVEVFRPSDLARLLDCQESRIGMIMHRKQNTLIGLYRASSYQHKPPNALGLKVKSYFLDLSGCDQVRKIMEDSSKPSRKRNRHNSDTNSHAVPAASEDSLSEAAGSLCYSTTPPSYTSMPWPGSPPPQFISPPLPLAAAAAVGGFSHCYYPPPRFYFPSPYPPVPYTSRPPLPVYASTQYAPYSAFDQYPQQ